MARVIAQRFELNDKYVSVIGEISVKDTFRKPALVIEKAQLAQPDEE